ncbi:MAG: Crp/Fnr family transcriptional regulator [Pleomorphochaeta sp.]
MQNDIEYINNLKRSKIFQNITDKYIRKLLPCLKASVKKFKKNQIIFHQGDFIEKVGIILYGELKIEKIDFWGNSSILKILTNYEMFGEIYAFEKQPLEVSIISNTDSEILFINFNKIISPCESACTFHTQLIINLLKIFANKTAAMNKKIEILSKRSIEDKLLTYLKSISLKTKNNEFSIPYNRQELADFLGVNRSALSKELMRLEKDGIIKYHKNNFKLI